jgi:hypothetical protein
MFLVLVHTATCRGIGAFSGKVGSMEPDAHDQPRCVATSLIECQATRSPVKFNARPSSVWDKTWIAAGEGLCGSEQLSGFGVEVWLLE